MDVRENMQRISYDEAVNRYNSSQEVYLLYWDGRECVVDEFEEMMHHRSRGGEFGYEVD